MRALDLGPIPLTYEGPGAPLPVLPLFQVGQRVWVELWWLARGKQRATVLSYRFETDELLKHHWRARFTYRVRMDATIRVPRSSWLMAGWPNYKELMEADGSDELDVHEYELLVRK